MIAYHVDRTNSLYENMPLDLIPLNDSEGHSQLKLLGLNSVSVFGCRTIEEYLSNFSSFNPLNSAAIDMDAERIRYRMFPDLVSRFQCIFAVKHLKNFSEWKDVLSINQNTTIWEIEYNPETAIERDAYYLRGGIANDPFKNLNYAAEYWSGKISNFPKMELLIPLPTKTVKIVDISKLVL